MRTNLQIAVLAHISSGARKEYFETVISWCAQKFSRTKIGRSQERPTQSTVIQGIRFYLVAPGPLSAWEGGYKLSLVAQNFGLTSIGPVAKKSAEPKLFQHLLSFVTINSAALFLGVMHNTARFMCSLLGKARQQPTNPWHIPCSWLLREFTESSLYSYSCYPPMRWGIHAKILFVALLHLAADRSTGAYAQHDRDEFRRFASVRNCS